MKITCEIEFMIVSEIFLAVLEMDKIVVESVIEKMDIHLKVNVITIPDDKDLGTADTLRYMHSYFTVEYVTVCYG